MNFRKSFKNLATDAMRAAKRSIYLTTAATVGFLTLKTATRLIPGNKDEKLLAKAEKEALK